LGVVMLVCTVNARYTANRNLKQELLTLEDDIAELKTIRQKRVWSKDALGIEECKSRKLCKNGGVCKQDHGHYVCDCSKTEYTGMHCTAHKGDGECARSLDLCNGGGCYDVYKDSDRSWSFYCKCKVGKEGKYCEETTKKINDPCDPNPCKNGGMCRKRKLTFQIVYQCKCPEGFVGDHCKTVTPARDSNNGPANQEISKKDTEILKDQLEKLKLDLEKLHRLEASKKRELPQNGKASESQDVKIAPQDLNAIPQDMKEITHDEKVVPEAVKGRSLDTQLGPQAPEAVLQDTDAIPQAPETAPQVSDVVPQDSDAVPQAPDTISKDTDAVPQDTKVESHPNDQPVKKSHQLSKKDTTELLAKLENLKEDVELLRRVRESKNKEKREESHDAIVEESRDMPGHVKHSKKDPRILLDELKTLKTDLEKLHSLEEYGFLASREKKREESPDVKYEN